MTDGVGDAPKPRWQLALDDGHVFPQTALERHDLDPAPNEKAKLAAAGVSQAALLPVMQLLDVLEYLVLHNLSLAPDSQPQPYSPQEVLAVQSRLNRANAHLSTAQLQEFLKARLDIKLSSSLAVLALANLVSRLPEP